MLYLAQTDTTAGFLSKDSKQINALKNRALNAPCLICVAELKTLQKFVRVPTLAKNTLRKAKKTSFIYPNKKALRMVRDHPHAKFIKKHTWLFSSSANKHGQAFNEAWARQSVMSLGGIVVDQRLFEGKASKIIALSRSKMKKIR